MGGSTRARGRTLPRRLRDREPLARTPAGRQCWRISSTRLSEETGVLPGADYQSRTWLLGRSGQHGYPGSDGGRARGAFRTGGVEERAVVLDGARRLVSLIVQLSKIVMRRGIPRSNRQRLHQCFLRQIEFPRCAQCDCEVYECIQVPRLVTEDHAKLCRRLLHLALVEQSDTVIVPSARV